MTDYETHEHDVLVIGAGGAGLRAAIEASARGASVGGAEAAEFLPFFSLRMEADAPARVLVDAEMVHPAFAEGMQTAVMQLERHAL